MLVKEPKKPKEAKNRKTLQFSSVPDNLALVERLVDEICEAFNISEDHYGNILVSITEAVNNAIQHGNKYNPDKEVEVSFESADDILYFTIEDEGDGFNFNNLPDPTDPENIEKPNGRGIFLMKNLADNVEFTDNGKRVVLDFKIHLSAN